MEMQPTAEPAPEGDDPEASPRTMGDSMHLVEQASGLVARLLGQADLLTGEEAPVGSDSEEPAQVDMVALAKTFEEVRCCGTFFLLMRSP